MVLQCVCVVIAAVFNCVCPCWLCFVLWFLAAAAATGVLVCGTGVAVHDRGFGGPVHWGVGTVSVRQRHHGTGGQVEVAFCVEAHRFRAQDGGERRLRERERGRENTWCKDKQKTCGV